MRRKGPLQQCNVAALHVRHVLFLTSTEGAHACLPAEIDAFPEIGKNKINPLNPDLSAAAYSAQALGAQ